MSFQGPLSGDTLTLSAVHGQAAVRGRLGHRARPPGAGSASTSFAPEQPGPTAGPALPDRGCLNCRERGSAIASPLQSKERRDVDQVTTRLGDPREPGHARGRLSAASRADRGHGRGLDPGGRAAAGAGGRGGGGARSGPLSRQARRQLHARSADHAGEGHDDLQQFLRVRLVQADLEGGPGAAAAALEGHDRRHGREADRDGRGRAHPQDAARGAPLPPPLCGGLVDRGAVHGLPAEGAGRHGAAPGLGQICGHDDLHGSRRWRRASASSGIPGPTPRA